MRIPFTVRPKARRSVRAESSVLMQKQSEFWKYPCLVHNATYRRYDPLSFYKVRANVKTSSHRNGSPLAQQRHTNDPHCRICLLRITPSKLLPRISRLIGNTGTSLGLSPMIPRRTPCASETRGICHGFHRTPCIWSLRHHHTGRLRTTTILKGNSGIFNSMMPFL